MPAYLVGRISASLAAEQAQRAGVSSGASVTPLLASTRRRPGRLLFAIAGAAAAVVLIGVVGSNLLTTNQSTTASDHAAAVLTSGSREASGATPPTANPKAAAGSASAPASIQIRLSDVRYTQADFVTQARALRGATFDPIQPLAPTSARVGSIGTAGGLTGCLSAIGAGGAQLVRADLAFYRGAACGDHRGHERTAYRRPMSWGAGAHERTRPCFVRAPRCPERTGAVSRTPDPRGQWLRWNNLTIGSVDSRQDPVDI